MTKLKVLIVCGTRPEIIKLSPVIKEFARRKYPFDIFFTNQHPLPSMSWNFFSQLGLDKIKKPIVLSGHFSPSTCFSQITALMPKYAAVVVHGDTNSALLGGLVGRWNHKKVIHVEAGLRSFNPLMIEEENRIMIDVISDLLFVPISYQLGNVKNCYGQKFVVGNPIADVVDAYQKRVTKLPIKSQYLFMTLHRPELVDHPVKLKAALEAVGKAVSKRYPKASIILPIHPRTADMLQKAKLSISNLLPQAFVIKPLDMFDTWAYIQNALAVITDSGGLQEEAAILKTPCFTLRDDTERGELIGLGANILLTLNPKKIERRIVKGVFKKSWRHPYGAQVSKKIVDRIILSLKASASD